MVTITIFDGRIDGIRTRKEDFGFLPPELRKFP
jgi:hypothetical protein